MTYVVLQIGRLHPSSLRPEALSGDNLGNGKLMMDGFINRDAGSKDRM